MKKGHFIAIQNSANDPGQLDLYFLDEIKDSYDFWTDTIISKVQEIVSQVNYFQPSRIKVHIDSVGGDAQAGLSIYNFLKNHDAKVEVEIIGLAGSIASVIAMAANKGKLKIARNGFMMIHKAEGIVGGTSDEIRQAAAVIDQYTAQIVDVYSQRTGKTTDEINALIAGGDYWMDGQAAVAQGFADETFNDAVNIQIAARLDPAIYKNIPEAVKAKMEDETPDDDDPLLNFFSKNFNMKKFVENFRAALKGMTVKNAADVASIPTQISDVMQGPLESFVGEVEAEITNKVDGMNPGLIDEITTAVTNKFEERIKNLETAKGELEKKNEELETEIANKIGGQTIDKETKKDEAKVIGTFVKHN